MKTCPSCKAQLHDDARTCTCGYFYPLEPSAKPVIGGFLILIGAIWVSYFAFGYETSVENPYAGSVPGISDHVHNMGLEFNRLIGVLVGLAVALSGIILVAAPKSADTPKK
jgi:hypothetical protein